MAEKSLEEMQAELKEREEAEKKYQQKIDALTQKRNVEKKRKAELERNIRTHRLCDFAGALESKICFGHEIAGKEKDMYVSAISTLQKSISKELNREMNVNDWLLFAKWIEQEQAGWLAKYINKNHN